MLITVCCNGDRGVLVQQLAMLIWENPLVFQPKPNNGAKPRRVALAMVTDYEPPLVKEVLSGDNGGMIEPAVELSDLIPTFPKGIQQQIPKGALPQPTRAVVRY